MRKIFLLIPIILVIACSKPTRFERLSSSDTNIDFKNAITEKDTFNILHNEYMYNGGGVGVADLNNDSLPDLIFSGNLVSSKIYLNKGDFEFEDITGRFIGLSNSQWFSGVTIVDINGDGWQDVYFTSTENPFPEKRKNRLWVNNGLDKDGLPSFTEMADQYGIADPSHSVHSGFFDYDLDGDLDLYILNNIVNKSVPTNYRPKITDGSSPNNDKLYRNDGNGKFSDVTIEAGIVYEGFGLGLAFGDINKDGYPDIYVSNDYISNDILYLNNRNGTFRNASTEYFPYQSKFSMGNDMVDINNDGNLDIMTVDMMPEQYARKKQTINGHSYFFYINDRQHNYQAQYVRNMLFVHNGFINGKMLPFSEVGQLTGLYQTEWSWSPLFADYDNDGDRDLMMTNGFPKDLTDKDFTNYKAQVYGYTANDEHMLAKIPIVKVSNYAFENTGNYSFKNQTANWGMELPSFSNGAAFVDLDNDGDLDYVVNNIDDEAFVYRNNTIGKINDHTNFIRIKLSGKAPNTMAVGAKVEIWSNDLYLYQENFGTRGYISSVDPVIHFGLRSNSKIDSIRIIWPKNDKHTFLKNIKANQVLQIAEPESGEAPVLLATSSDNVLFKALPGAIDYKHSQEDYVDFFQQQRILQHKLSQIGPCMSKGDINGDGTEDLIIGGSSEAPTSVYLNKQNRFIKTIFKGLTETKTCTEADLIIADFDNDSDNDVLSIAGGYEVEDANQYQHYLYRNDGKVFNKILLPLPAFPASVVRASDFDHDGDADIFVGARVTRGAYPFAPHSYVLINDKGQFSADTLGFDLGMVTDAVWSDYNGDGWQDIIAVREWNSIVILENEKGKQFKIVKNNILEQKHGLWSAVAAGDLDQDGDDDYVFGNLGNNHRFTVNDTYPLNLYAVDIDNNSFIDPITTGYWRDLNGIMTEYPVNYLDELAAQSPFFRKKFTNYTKFSYTPFDSILNKSTVADDSKFYVNTTAHFILWNDKGNFIWQELQPEVQFSPVKEILIQDLNGDNFNDLIIAGNDYSFDVSTGYYDSNKGIVLMGKKDRDLELLLPSESGLLLQGQVGSMLYFTGTPSILVAGINRDSVYFYQSKSNTPVRIK